MVPTCRQQKHGSSCVFILFKIFFENFSAALQRKCHLKPVAGKDVNLPFWLWNLKLLLEEFFFPLVIGALSTLQSAVLKCYCRRRELLSCVSSAQTKELQTDIRAYNLGSPMYQNSSRTSLLFGQEDNHNFSTYFLFQIFYLNSRWANNGL